MKPKFFFLMICLATASKDYAQTAINRNIAVAAGQHITMEFDYPELIRISSWDGQDISIQGSVSINGGENDDAFVVETATKDGVIHVEGRIKDIKGLPQRITVNRDGQKVIFRDKKELEKYQATHGRDYNYMSMGPDMDIQLEIRVPRNVTTSIVSTYGMVEVKNFSGPLTVTATYGGVDAALSERAIGELVAETGFGQIYTDLDVDFKGDNVREEPFHTLVSAKPGQGPSYAFESKFGNVYLRKAAGN